LEEITIPAAVASIGDGFFAYCAALKAINVDSANNAYASDHGVLFNKAKTALLSYPPGKQGTSYTVPSGVVSVGENAFSGSVNLLAIHLSADVAAVADWVFNYCARLEEIDVDAANNAYASENGVLFNKDKTALIAYPASKSGNAFAVPDGVRVIAAAAFHGCAALTEITLPQGLIEIGESAFAMCEGIGTIAIPEGVTALKKNTFMECANLRTVQVPASVLSFGWEVFADCHGSMRIFGYSGSQAEAYALENEIRFMPLEPNFIITTPKAKFAGGAIVAEVNTNINVTAQRVQFAVYDTAGKLLGYQTASETLPSKRFSAEFENIPQESAKYIKVFIWKSLENMIPISDGAAADIEAE
jgi:hypothetical protein